MRGKRMIFLIILIVLAMNIVLIAFACEEKEQYASNKDEITEWIPMEATAYCYGSTRCDGKPVRKGICAAKKEWYGKTACIYTDNNGKAGEFIGYFECLDTGGDYRIKDGKAIDIYMPDYNDCIQFGRRKVLVLLLDGEG